LTFTPAGCTVVVPPINSCPYTNGQFLFNFYGETIEAKFCGGVLYARATWSGFKPRAWLVATGLMTQTQANCFAENNPGCGALRVSSEQTEEPFEVYPNPSNGKIKVSFTLQQDENVWINLYDNQGRSLQIRDFEGKFGKNLIELDLQDYPSGAYFINLQSSQKREVQKVMKVN
jgi:Secretion system C-terminal sorting domain